MINTDCWRKILKNAAMLLKTNKRYLCELDSVAGDGDHGITIEKIADCILKRVNEYKESDSIKVINDDLSNAFMNVNGGSAGPLWGTIFEGMAEAIDNKEELDENDIKDMFMNIKSEFAYVSRAKVGDKTLVDALYPAIDAIVSCNGELIDILRDGFEAAKKGAEDTKLYASKFGRAKSLGDRSKGHEDPGAVSISLFFKGLYEGLK